VNTPAADVQRGEHIETVSRDAAAERALPHCSPDNHRLALQPSIPRHLSHHRDNCDNPPNSANHYSQTN
jgi:hypothetical protein